jgi:hypothetical protein
MDHLGKKPGVQTLIVICRHAVNVEVVAQLRFTFFPQVEGTGQTLAEHVCVLHYKLDQYAGDPRLARQQPALACKTNTLTVNPTC